MNLRKFIITKDVKVPDVEETIKGIPSIQDLPEADAATERVETGMEKGPNSLKEQDQESGSSDCTGFICRQFPRKVEQ